MTACSESRATTCSWEARGPTGCGGPGDDRLLVRDTARDRVVCGPGRDTVVGDQRDVAAADCEVVLRKKVPDSAPPGEPEPEPAARAGACRAARHSRGVAGLVQGRDQRR